MAKATLTLYTVIGNPNRIPVAIEQHFKPVTNTIVTEGRTTTLTLHDNTLMVFSLSHESTRASFITSHVTGMANYFSQAETEHSEVKENVLRQINCFNCVTGITFETDDDEERTSYLTSTLFNMAAELNAFLLYPNMSIFNGQRQLVFSIRGESELTSFVPIGNSDLLDAGRPSETEADRLRRERSIALLQQQGIPFLPQLRSEVTESEASLKTHEEMIQRATALFAVAVYSEVLLSEDSNREEALSYIEKLNTLYGVKSYFTPAEEAYIANPEPEETESIQFVWRYECCAVLLWAAGVVDDLPSPSSICDVPVIAGIFWQHKSLAELLSKSIPRSTAELLDAADLTLRYDWASVDARINGREAPGNLDSGVVHERHYVFNWIISAGNNAPWDSIQPNT